MQRTMLLAKLHRATVTERDLNYMGSITIDKKLLEESGMLENEKVDIYNIENGNRFSTYIIAGETGSGIIGINGAAARLVSIGDKLIIADYGELSEKELENHQPIIVILDDDENKKFHRVK